MNKLMFDSGLKSQVMSFPEAVRAHLDGVKKGMTAPLFPSDNLLAGIKRIYITGCGDCNAAYVALVPLMRLMLGSSCRVYADLPVNMSRYVSLEIEESSLDKYENCLMIVLSVGGSPARLVETVLRAKRRGMHTMAVTNTPDSPVGRAADYILHVNNPPFPFMSPGCRDYLGTMLGTLLSAARISDLRGGKGGCHASCVEKAVLSLADSYGEILSAMDDFIFDFALSVKDCVTSVECVADGYGLASALFFPAKIIETSGRFGSFTDSISFRSTSLHFSEPEKILTLIYGCLGGSNRESIAASVHMAVKAGRPVLFIADAPAREFGITDDVACFVIPKAPDEYPMLGTFFDHLPGDLLAAYLCSFWGENYFRNDGTVTAWSAPALIPPKASKIVIVEDGVC